MWYYHTNLFDKLCSYDIVNAPVKDLFVISFQGLRKHNSCEELGSETTGKSRLDEFQ